MIKVKIAVLGAGAYGCALAQILNENKNEVTIWTPFENEVKELTETRKSPKLPNIELYNNIQITNDLKQALHQTELIVEAIPTAFLSESIKKVKKYYQNTPICIATKGIEQNTNLFVYDVVKNILNTEKIAVISGPSFAIDIAGNYPVGLTLACQDKETIDIIVNHQIQHMIIQWNHRHLSVSS